jgi:FlaA1/EpsC-like NDP-sugar epimerase
MYRQLTNPKFYLMILLDLIIFGGSLWLAFLLRFEFRLAQVYMQQLEQLLPYSIVVKTVSFFALGMYMGMWRYTNIRDFWQLLLASAVGSLALISLAAFWFRFAGFPRSVFVIDFVFTFVFCGGLRVCIRTLYLLRGELRHPLRLFDAVRAKKASNPDKTLIIGAGDAGEKLLREIIESPHLRYQVVGFLDDNIAKRNRSIHGVRVLGEIAKLYEMVEEGLPVDQVFIALPSASGPQVRRIVELCERCAVAYKILPGLTSILSGKVSVQQLREVRYEDLLGRAQVRLETDAISSMLRGKSILVTGAGGSIGSELCRQIVRYEPKRLILLDSSEANLYAIEMEFRHELNFPSHRALLATVQDRELMAKLFAEHRPRVVFHAAAYKHVPLLEDNPWQAVENNVQGSRVVMEAALAYEAERFVLVSTDKAVRPTNIMGASKRVAELLLQNMDGERTIFSAVRFGNVVGSSGSVIPLFRRQIERGGPVTVTHPEVTRFFMSIEEACQLILQAGTLAKGEEIFVLDMGTPIKIADMANDLIRLCGKEPGEDVEVQFIGLRPGEKLYEELIASGEDVIPTHHEKIMKLRPHSQSFDGYGGTVGRGLLNDTIEELRKRAAAHDVAGIRALFREIVPEYAPDNDNEGK